VAKPNGDQRSIVTGLNIHALSPEPNPSPSSRAVFYAASKVPKYGIFKAKPTRMRHKTGCGITHVMPLAA
jgi:hypothetical protein